MNDEAVETFRFNTAGLARWSLYVPVGVIALICGLGTVGLALQLNPVSLIFLAAGGAGVKSAYIYFRGCSDPERNFVVLLDDRFKVRVYKPLESGFTEILYALVERIEEHVVHSDFHALWWIPQFSRPDRPHTDIHLKRWHLSVFGSGLTMVKVLHLDVVDADRFVYELRTRMAVANEAPNPA